ncbi:MAG: hypothetical protein QW683_08950 [Candidatus Caldarchaeum sp.]
MTTLHLKARIQADGTLALKTPTPLPEGEMEVTLRIHPVSTPASAWPEGYFERTFGKEEDALERPPQGNFEAREALDEAPA